MGKSYSQDLRERVVAYVRSGYSRRAAARRFGVSESFAVKLLQRVCATGSSSPARQGRPGGFGRLDAYADYLVAAVEAQPDLTMPQLSVRLAADHGVTADPAVLSRFLCRRGFTYKKNADGLGSRTREGQTTAP